MLKDKLQHAFKELYLVYERKWVIQKEIDSLKMESIEKNAIHKVGDIVEVYDEYGKYIADGVVERIATSLFVDAMGTKAFIEKPDKLLNDIEKIRYEILAQNGKQIYFESSNGNIIDNRPKVVELTLDEIAKKLNIDVNLLKIKK